MQAFHQFLYFVRMYGLRERKIECYADRHTGGVAGGEIAKSV